VGTRRLRLYGVGTSRDRVGGCQRRTRPRCWTGHTEIAQAWRDYLRVWEDHRSEAEEYREIDNERILVLISVTGRGKTSGVDLGQMQAQGANPFRIQGGQVTRLVLYTDRDRALADLGLTPEEPHEPR
jgi:hypothetical protein